VEKINVANNGSKKNNFKPAKKHHAPRKSGNPVLDKEDLYIDENGNIVLTDRYYSKRGLSKPKKSTNGKKHNNKSSDK